MQNPVAIRPFVRFVLVCLLSVGALFTFWSGQPAAAQVGTVTVVSAASYESTLAPGSIAALFGTNLANATMAGTDTDPGTAGIQLPTSLGGATVTVGGRTARLFFVSPTQINIQIPTDVPIGAAAVVVQNGGSTSNGTATIATLAPAIFTFNPTGMGVVAGGILRLRNNVQTYEDLARLEGSTWVTKPIDLGPATDQVALTLYGSGWRNATSGQIKMVLGGTEITPLYAGPQGSLIGLDQINLLIPRALIGRGKVAVTAVATNFPTSNAAEIEIASAGGSTPPIVNNLAAAALAAQTINLTGSGFAPTASQNQVRIGGVEAQVVTAAASQLSVIVPFGAESTAVTVATSTGEGRSSNPLMIRTSISGLVETTDRLPLNNVTIKTITNQLQLISTPTNVGGTFVLGELPANTTSARVTIDGSTLPTNPPYGVLVLDKAVTTQRDNQFPSPIALQQVTGASTQVGGSTATGAGSAGEDIAVTIPAYADLNELPNNGSGFAQFASVVPGTAQQPAPNIVQIGNVTLELPNITEALFADGNKRGTIFLTQITNSRMPVTLPPGIFSSAIVQITPFGTTFNPGGKLTFPNPEGYPANSKVTLYRLDQRSTSPTYGRIVASGSAAVTADGSRIETDANAITEATYYFVATQRQTTTIVGRVLEQDRSPVRRALVRYRGQESFTDGNGGFVLRSVPVTNAQEFIVVEASFARPSGRVDRALSAQRAPVINGLTNVGDILLPDPVSNQAPVILIPTTLQAEAGKQNDFPFAAFDPDSLRGATTRVTGAAFASIVLPGATQQTLPILRLTPTANQLGTFTLDLTATDAQGLATTRTVTVTVVAANSAPVAQNVAATTNEDTAVPITLVATDANNEKLSYFVVTGPANGRLSGTPPLVTYTPNANFEGGDSFTYRASDGKAESNLATVSLRITGVNDAPVLTVPGPQVTTPERALQFGVSATDLDAGQTVTVSATNLPAGATFSNNQFRWTPTANQFGTFTVTFTAIDNGSPARSDAKTVTITVVSAISSQWTQTRGPLGGTILALATVVSTQTSVLAATNEGLIFRSTDAGLNWTRVYDANAEPTIECFAVTGNTVYAGAIGQVLVSTDTGQTWAVSGTGLPADAAITDLAITSQNVVFAATERGTVHRLSGTVWTDVSAGGLPVPGIEISCLTASGTVLLAGNVAGGLYRSTDSGSKWSAVSLPTTVQNVADVVVNGTELFLAADGLGVLRSLDGGQTFTLFATFAAAFGAVIPNGVSALLVGTLNDRVHSINANGQVTPLGTTGMPTREISALTSVQGTLLAGTYTGGLYRSTNSGQSWASANTGIVATVSTALAAGGNFVFASSFTGFNAGFANVQRTSNQGQTWEYSGIPNLTTAVSALAYVGTSLLATTYGQGLWRSIDNGTTWTALTQFNETDMRALAVNGTSVFAAGLGGIYRSVDNGASWTQVSQTGALSLSVAGTALFAGTFNYTLVRSNDNGATWVSANLGQQAIVSVVSTGTTLIAAGLPDEGATGGIFVSTNNGQSWTANSGVGTPFVFKLLVLNGTTYAATGLGIFRSTNAGGAWTAYNEALPNLLVPNLLANGTTLYAGTGGSGVFVRNTQ